MNVSDLQTPALLLDKPAMERNMEKIDALRQGTSMALYPHYKSLKCPAIAKLQLARGARGITCAKLSEALDLAQAGVKNIVIANQVVQAEKLPVLARLARQCVLTVCADDARNVRRSASSRPFLMSARNKPAYGNARFYEQCAHAFGSVELMRRKAHHVNA